MEAWGETWADRLMAKTPGCTRLRKWSEVEWSVLVPVAARPLVIPNLYEGWFLNLKRGADAGHLLISLAGAVTVEAGRGGAGHEFSSWTRFTSLVQPEGQVQRASGLHRVRCGRLAVATDWRTPGKEAEGWLQLHVHSSNANLVERVGLADTLGVRSPIGSVVAAQAALEEQLRTQASPILLIETLSTSGWFVAHLDKLRLQWRQDEKHADLRRISAQDVAVLVAAHDLHGPEGRGLAGHDATTIHQLHFGSLRFPTSMLTAMLGETLARYALPIMGSDDLGCRLSTFISLINLCTQDHERDFRQVLTNFHHKVYRPFQQALGKAGDGKMRITSLLEAEEWMSEQPRFAIRWSTSGIAPLVLHLRLDGMEPWCFYLRLHGETADSLLLEILDRDFHKATFGVEQGPLWLQTVSDFVSFFQKEPLFQEDTVLPPHRKRQDTVRWEEACNCIKKRRYDEHPATAPEPFDLVNLWDEGQ